jgi:hypothetical protein
VKKILNPQEIYILERYISSDYFCELRDTWAEMVVHIESCLDKLMKDLPKNYRAKPLPEQPDLVWGNRVLPNFRSSLQGLNTGFILLTHGDFKGLNQAWGPYGDFKGQMEYWSGWMERPDENRYGELLNKSVMLASNICRTERAGWEPLDLANYSEHWGALNLPDYWPNYRINKVVSVVTGGKLEQSGVYVPDVENSCAEFLFMGYKVAPSAKVLLGTRPLINATTGEKYDEERIFEERSCTWYLVERDTEMQLVQRENDAGAPRFVRLAGGEVCAETGFYFTPAQQNSRRLFERGAVMPSLDTKYGATIWQWDENQI